jgi:hypothetical protein
MVCLNEPVELNPRHERFVSLVAAGLPAGRAYEQAGYASRGNAADVGASKLVRNPKVARALEIERATFREQSSLGREEKLRILAEIASQAFQRPRDRIAAIKLHNEMTGETSPKGGDASSTSFLEGIRERAREIASPLARPVTGSSEN